MRPLWEWLITRRLVMDAYVQILIVESRLRSLPRLISRGGRR